MSISSVDRWFGILCTLARLHEFAHLRLDRDIAPELSTWLNLNQPEDYHASLAIAGLAK